MIFKITDPNGKEVFSVESVTLTTKTLFEVADFKDIRENHWAKEWKYVKDLENNRILVTNKFGVKKVFDFDKRSDKPFVHSANELESYTENKNKSTESLDVNGLLKAKFENVPNEIVNFVHKNKASVVDQILQWGLKHVKAYGYDIDRSVFGGKPISDVTEKDVASVINTKQNDFKSFKIKVPDDREKRRFPRAWFAVCFEWLVDEEHAASVVFDKNGKAIRICQYSAAFSEPEDYEIKDGTYSPN